MSSRGFNKGVEGRQIRLSLVRIEGHVTTEESLAKTRFSDFFDFLITNYRSVLYNILYIEFIDNKTSKMYNNKEFYIIKENILKDISNTHVSTGRMVVPP
jgi:hypothetical protein